MVYFRPGCCCGPGMFGCPQVFRYVCDCVYIYIQSVCISIFQPHGSMHIQCICVFLQTVVSSMYVFDVCMYACVHVCMHAMLSHVMFSNVLLCYVVLCWVVMFSFGLRFVLFRGVMLCYVSVWSAMSCQVTSCYVMICCVRYVCNICNVHI